MSGGAARSLDLEFPKLPPDVVAAYRNAPAHVVAEILNGELSLMPRPQPRHARVAVRMAGEFRPFDNPRGDEPGGWIILIEPELRLGHLPDIVVPDLAGWHRDRLPEEVFTDDDIVRIAIAPDWVCEVLSPSTAKIDRTDKLEIYLREGVGHAWLVDPAAHILEIFRATPEGWLRARVFVGDAPVRAEPFDAIEFPLGVLWGR